MSDLDLETALINAVMYNHTDIVDILLKDKKLQSLMVKEKQKLKKQNDLNGALIAGCKGGRIFDVTLILLTSPNIDPTANNNLALKYAIVYNHTDIVQLLLSREDVRKEYDGLVVKKVDDEALILACETGDFDTFLEIIITKNVDASSSKNAALVNAFKFRHDKIIKILLKNSNVQQSLLKISQMLLYIYGGSYRQAYHEACELGLSENVLAMILTSNELSYKEINKGILVAYRYHQYDTAKIISTFNSVFRKRKNAHSNSILESYCRSGNVEGVVQTLASGYLDPTFESNRALTVALAAGQNEIAEFMMTDKSVANLAERIKSESLEKNKGDGVKAMLSACGSSVRNSSVVASLLLLDDAPPSAFAVSSLFNALKGSDFECFNIIFKSVKVGSYFSKVFNTLLDDFKKETGQSEEAFVMNFFKIEHLAKVFAIIQHFFMGKLRYSDAFIERGLLRLDRDTMSVLTRIPQLREYMDGAIARSIVASKSETESQAFEYSCKIGDIRAVCSFLLTSDFTPMVKDLAQAVINQHIEIVELLLQNEIIYKAILETKERLLVEADGDKQKAFRNAYTSEKGVLNTLCLTVINDPDIDLAENDNHAIKTSINSRSPEIFMILAYNKNLANQYQQIRREIMQLFQGDREKALIESLRSGKLDRFLSIFLIDVVSGNLNPSFNSNLALKTAFKNGHLQIAQVLLLFKKVELLQISEKRALIEYYGTWKMALSYSCEYGRLDDVISLSIGSNDYGALLNGLSFAAQYKHEYVVDYLRRIIPYKNRLAYFKCSSHGAYPKGDFLMINRGDIIGDGVAMLNMINSIQFQRLKYLKVRFINTLGLIEADSAAYGPGPFKEFMEEIWREALKREHKLFEGTDDGHVIISPFAKDDAQSLNIFYQLGRVLGKASLFGISLDIPFADFVYTKLLQKSHDGIELKSLDHTLAKNLEWLYNYEGNIEDLGLTFSIDELNSDSSITRVDLSCDGSNIPVNNSNMIDYISKVITYKLDEKSSSQYAKLVQGFTNMVGHKFSGLFSPCELKTLLYGENQYFEISDLRPYVKFQFASKSAKFLENSFWQVFEEFTPQERNDFLFYVTSSHRPPVGGFQYLDPPLTLKFENSIPKSSLPRAFTCGNSLYLSVHYDKQDLKEKIKKAISLNDGFSFG